MSKRAFTLVELMVVIAMIAILSAAMGVGVSRAQERSRISKAETETGAMTQAIYAYRDYDKNFSLSSYEMEDAEANAAALAFILGGVDGRDGKPVPVLYNGAVGNDKVLRDPWGRPYRVTVRRATIPAPQVDDITTGVYVPNNHRLTDKERQ